MRKLEMIVTLSLVVTVEQGENEHVDTAAARAFKGAVERASVKRIAGADDFAAMELPSAEDFEITCREDVRELACEARTERAANEDWRDPNGGEDRTGFGDPRY